MRIIKKRFIIVALLGVLILGGWLGITLIPVSEQHELNRKPITKHSFKITAVGDSLTAGVGDLQKKGYVGLAVHALKEEKNVENVSFQNFGHPGDQSSDLLHVLKRQNVQDSIRQSDMLFLTIGSNDIVSVLRQHFMNLHVDDFDSKQHSFEKNLKTIFSEVKALNPSIQIYYFGLYNPFEDYLGEAEQDFMPILNNWNKQGEKIADQYSQVYFIPTYDLFRGKGNDLLYDDHFHPNHQGYTEMANRLVQLISGQKALGGN